MNRLALLLPLLVSSCVFLPTTAERQKYYDKCKMATKKLTLEPHIDRDYSICHGRDVKKEPLMCLLLSGVVASASLVVSGSIVLVGNTIHWVEYQSGCEPKNTKVIKHKNVKKPQKPGVYISIGTEAIDEK